MSDDPRVGTELAGYRIESLLGWGGMSVVYLAEELRLKRRVALKLLAASLAEDESFRDRFLRESELAASIDHPNIVPIYEAGTTEDLLFIAMRYVEGRDLKERLQHGGLDPADAIGIVAQVASALDAAHARGLVHRDVKPSNVLLDTGARPDGSDHVYLADFGLTRRVSEEAGIGDDGHLLGTIDYVAPEQIAGEEIDGRADVYSLGCVLYECLVGQPPFRRDSDLAVVFAHLETESPAPSAGRPELPAALDGVIARALAKEPERRYPSCRELARAALAVAVDEANRLLVDAASRAAAGRSDLSEVEAELAGKVIDLQLVREQARALAGPVTPARVAAEGICPFKGLASFEPADADYFFGRERLVAELVARLVGAGFLGIVGPSGSGKSSVLRAGLLPALAGGVLPGSGGWRRLLLRPGERPLDELRRVLVSGAKDPLAEALDALPADERLFVAVDQLEELFTACRSDAERAPSPTRSPARWLIRRVEQSSWSRCAPTSTGASPRTRGSRSCSARTRCWSDPCRPRSCGVPSRCPRARWGCGWSRSSPTRSSTTWRASRARCRCCPPPCSSSGRSGKTTRSSWLLTASQAASTAPSPGWPRAHTPASPTGASRSCAPSCYAWSARARATRRCAAALHSPSSTWSATGTWPTCSRRWPTAASSPSARAPSRSPTRRCCANGHACASGSKRTPKGARLRRHITQAATEWDTAGRDQGELYRGVRLAAALDWTADHSLDLNELEREFVSESREASEKETKRVRRTNRRLRGLLAGVAVLLAAAVAGGIFAAVQRSEARDAETGQLAQRLGAQALVEEDLDLSLLLARQAVAIDDSPQTRGYLLAALRRSPAAIGIMHGHGGVLRGIAISPDGKTLAVGDSPGILFFDARTYEQIGDPLPETGLAESLAFSPDGRTLAVGGDHIVRLVDARTREQLAKTAVGGVAERTAFTKDGSQLVVLFPPGAPTSAGEAGAQITIRDAATLEPIGLSILPEASFGAYVGFYFASPQFALTPDNRSLITASEDGELAWWDLRSRKKTRTLKIANGLHALALSPDGRTAAVGIDRGIQLVDLGAGTVRTATGGLTGRPNWVLFSPDGKTVVSTSIDGTVTLWDVESATPRETLRGHSSSVQQPVFSPDGATLYTVSHDGNAIAWDLAGDRRLGRPFTFTHDRTFAGGYDGHPGEFSPDGRLFAVGLKNEGIELRDARNPTSAGARLRATGGPEHSRSSSARMAESSLFRASSPSRPSGTSPPEPRSARGSRPAAAGRCSTCPPTGRRLLETHGNGQGAVWDIDPESWAQRACAIAGRTLSREEWEEFLPGRPYEPACGT